MINYYQNQSVSVIKAKNLYHQHMDVDRYLLMKNNSSNNNNLINQRD